MKEHMVFVASALTPKNYNLIQPANELKDSLNHLLVETVMLSNGVISPEAIASGEIITQFTLNAELATQYYTGIAIDTRLTQAEAALVGSSHIIYNPMLEQRVYALNQKAIAITTAVVQLKETILRDVLACRMFTLNYPLLVDHILREARFYLKMLFKLQRFDEIDTAVELIEQEIFWNRIMAEHSKFIRGFLDPTEEELMEIANNFAKEFDVLTEMAMKTMDSHRDLSKTTEESLEATQEIRKFKAQGTEGILRCKIKSIILPLLGDHTLREANHYMRLLKMFKHQAGCQHSKK
jgi:hypothetical protein